MNNRIKLVACSIAAVATGVLFAQQAPVSDTVMNPLANNPTAAIDGQRIFDGTCQTCHGAAGVGDAGRGGPALNTTGLKHGDGDADLFRTIRQGVSGTQMPPYKGLRDEQVWQLVSYLRTLQNRGASPEASRGAMVPEGDVAAGEALFYGKAACAACHEINARGGVTGPDLSNAGRLTSAAIRQKIVSPNDPLPPAPVLPRGGGGRGAPPPVTLVAKMPDGREIRGVRRNEDTYSAQIVDASGQLHLLNKLQAAVSVENRSLMPGDYATRLSADEITNIVGFLRMQQGRDQNKIVAQPVAGGVSYQRLLNAKAEPHNWMMYWGDYSGQHYSALTQITPANARQLKTAWSFPILGGNSTLEATPIVVDGVMYTTGSGNPATVTAIDARSGRQIWRWTRQQKIVNPYEINPFARGVAILGNRNFPRHARRRAGRGRRSNRPNAVGAAGRRHDGRLEHHEPAARAEGHGHHRDDGR
jgi:mono/diheme cytochrome c family protein